MKNNKFRRRFPQKPPQRAPLQPNSIDRRIKRRKNQPNRLFPIIFGIGGLCVFLFVFCLIIGNNKESKSLQETEALQVVEELNHNDEETGNASLDLYYFKKYNPNEYVYEVLLRTLAEVQEDSEEDFDDVCVSLYEPDMSQEVLDKIIYTGTEFSDACNNLKKCCQEVPAEGAWLSYLYDADELSYLYGGMSSIMEETENEENRKKLAVYAREIDRIVN